MRKNLVQNIEGTLVLNPHIVEALKAMCLKSVARLIGEWAAYRAAVDRGKADAWDLAPELGLLCPALGKGKGIDIISGVTLRIFSEA